MLSLRSEVSIKNDKECLMEAIVSVLDKIDSVMYYPILIIVMALAGIYFTV